MPTFLILAEASSGFLVGWWMALIIPLPFIPWAWLISSRLDKDAKYYHLKPRMWSGIHLSAGALALAAMLFVPVPGVGWVVGVLLMLAPILVYWKIRNQAVPEGARFALTGRSIAERQTARRQARAAKDAVLQFIDHRGKRRPIPLREDPQFALHMLAEDVLGPALEARASRVEMAVGPSGCTVQQTIDGVRYKRETIPADAAVALIDYLKELAGLDVEDRRRRQVGDLRLSGPSGMVEVTVTTAGSSTGQLMRIEFERAQRLARPFDGMGLLPSQLEALRALEQAHERHGIMLLGAPAGQGLTTTCYSMVGRHDAYTANIKTLEREVILRLDGVDHQQFDPNNADVDYATAIQSILRRDPDIVLVDLIKDRETAVVIAEPGMQGPLIYVPQQLPTIVEQIREWVKLTGDVKAATKALRCVTNQRLMRTLCPSCRQAFTPSAEQLKKLNLPAERARQLYQASGQVQVKNKIEKCPICGGTGYLGQTAAFEVFVIDDEARRILASGDLKAALGHARRNKMIYLQEAALSKVLAGETTIDEVVRATASPRAESQAQPATPAPA